MSDTNVRGQLVEAWKLRLQRFYDGSVTVTEFCAAEGVSTPSFYQWQHRIKALDPNFGPPDRRRRNRQRTDGGRTKSTAASIPTSKAPPTAMIPAVPEATRNNPSSAFQPIQLTTTTGHVTPLASIQLPSGVIIELQHDPNMICQVLERFLPLALQAGGPSC
jgi:hypothetical protein